MIKIFEQLLRRFKIYKKQICVTKYEEKKIYYLRQM